VSGCCGIYRLLELSVVVGRDPAPRPWLSCPIYRPQSGGSFPPIDEDADRWAGEERGEGVAGRAGESVGMK